ncbi:MAG: hypothetical protein ACTSWM_04470, partial [Alphaproteobacteria bacterium]
GQILDKGRSVRLDARLGLHGEAGEQKSPDEQDFDALHEVWFPKIMIAGTGARQIEILASGHEEFANGSAVYG